MNETQGYPTVGICSYCHEHAGFAIVALDPWVHGSDSEYVSECCGAGLLGELTEA